MGYYTDLFIYRRRQAKKRPSRRLMDVRMFTVGPVAENCFLFRQDGATEAVIVDPGEEAPKLLGAIEELGLDLQAILLTHTHFDHVGAVAPVAKATGAPVYCPKLEVPVLQDIMSFVPWPGFGPFESWDPEETVEGGEQLQLAGFDIDVIFTPGHSPGHVTYAVEDALFSGDVLFEGSVGRIDLPGGDWPTLVALDRVAARSLPRRAARLPGPHGPHHARPRARDEPVPARAGVSAKLQAPRGTFDVLPADAPARQAVEDAVAADPRGRRATAASRRRRSRRTELFARGVGEATDIVQKEMFSFEEYSLRPEGTAPVCRAYLEHGMHKLPQPVKLWYLGAVLPPRAPAGRPLPPVLAGRRRGDRLRRPERRRRDHRAAARAARRARRARAAAADREPRHARVARRLPRACCRPTCATTPTSCRRRCASASTSTRCARSTPRTPARSA